MFYIDVHTHNVETCCPAIIDISDNKNYALPKNCQGYSYGIHPNFIGDCWQENILELERLAQNGEILAVGECGFDKNSPFDREIQNLVFTKQLLIAKKYNLPVIVHCVGLYSLTFRALNLAALKIPIVLHGYNGNSHETRQFLKFPNIYFSFGATILRNGTHGAKSLPDIPLNRILIESDTQFYISFETVIDKIAKIKNTDFQEVATALNTNFFGIFPELTRKL